MSDATKFGLKFAAIGGVGFVILAHVVGGEPLAAAVGVVSGLVLLACLTTFLEWLAR